jgi:hypothetical protein
MEIERPNLSNTTACALVPVPIVGCRRRHERGSKLR